jgi:hypothetical protein
VGGAAKCAASGHYADYDEARRRYEVSERRYTKNLRIERSLRANGWDIFRFSNVEIREVAPEQFRSLTSHVFWGL